MESDEEEKKGKTTMCACEREREHITKDGWEDYIIWIRLKGSLGKNNGIKSNNQLLNFN